MDKITAWLPPQLSPVLGLLSVVGGGIATFFGGWDAALGTLILFMFVDYVTGLLVAGVFKRSPKSDGGALESHAGWKGLVRKGVTLLVVLVAVRLDIVIYRQQWAIITTLKKIQEWCTIKVMVRYLQ